MAQEDFSIKLKIASDDGGVVKAKQGLKGISQAAQKAARESKDGFARMQAGVGRVTGAIGALRNIITGFGVVGLIMPIISAFKSWQDEIKRTEDRAKALREEMAVKSQADEIKALADNYRSLGESIQAVAEARQRDNELFSEEVRIRREAQDADMAAAEADALAGVDPNAPDADKQRERIRGSFEASRARTAADRKREDVVFRRQALRQQADDATGAADMLESSLGADDKAVMRAMTKASTLEALSKERNEKDGTWYNPRKRTEAGDAERDRLRKEAETARKEAERLEAEKKAKAREIAELRTKATHAGKMSDLLFTSIGTAETERQTVTTRQAAGDAAEQAKAAADAAQVADATRARQLLEQQKAEIVARIAAEQAKKDAAGMSVYEAQGNLDMVNLGGDVRARRGATVALHAAQSAAQNVNHAADTAINALVETLQKVEARLKAAQSYLESQSKRQRNAWSESPAGT